MNISLYTGKIRITWKHATIEPMPKAFDPMSPRPSPFLSCLGKTMERIIVDRLKYKSLHLHPLFSHFRRNLLPPIILPYFDVLLTRCFHIRTRKACELANPSSILPFMQKKGLRGNYLPGYMIILLTIECMYASRSNYQGFHWAEFLAQLYRTCGAIGNFTLQKEHKTFNMRATFISGNGPSPLYMPNMPLTL